MVLEKTLESPLDSKEIQPVHHKGNQSWMFFGRTHAEAETPILWPPDVKNWLIWKDPDARKDWRQEEKEDRGWDNGHEFESTPGVGDGQGGLMCCSPWGSKESDMTEQLNWTDVWMRRVVGVQWPSSEVIVRCNKNSDPILQDQICVLDILV